MSQGYLIDQKIKQSITDSLNREPTTSGRPLMKASKISGPRNVSWGTSDPTSASGKMAPLVMTCCFRYVKRFLSECRVSNSVMMGVHKASVDLLLCQRPGQNLLVRWHPCGDRVASL
jgi:hypothetical protein